MNVYELRGPEFLQVLIAAETTAILLALLSRKLVLNYGESKPVDKTSFDHYDAAYLNGGSKHMFLTALTSMEHQSKIEVNLLEKTTCLKDKVGQDAHDIEKIVQGALWHKDTKIKDVFDTVKPSLDKYQQKMSSFGLVPSKEQEALAQLLPFQIVILPILFLAVPKFFIGIAHHRPVAFLAVIAVLSAITALFFLVKRPLRTTKGELLLNKWKADCSALKDNFKYSASTLQTRDLALGYALFAAFTFNLLNPQKQALATNSGTNIWSYSPASCGGSSCGGASCGGGGCGGCGGCGS